MTEPQVVRTAAGSWEMFYERRADAAEGLVRFTARRADLAELFRTEYAVHLG